MPDFLPAEIIRAKRDGRTLAPKEIAFFINGLTSGAVSEGQAAAFAMAVFFRGLALEERVALTLAMRDSGAVLDWSDLPGPALDKHSTGGIGDTVSLMLAPMVAACGGFVPMISGRGLGHTGGTLDKLDAIPGYKSQPALPLFHHVVREAGCAIIGQTPDLAPADKRLYAIRDVTATVESLDLITASILSKKLAAGLSGLVLDVKAGNGAFMTSLEDARALAASLVEVANGAGLKTHALLTDMNEPLGSAAGNALEVRLAVDFLTGAHRDSRLDSLTRALGTEMLRIGGLAKTAEEAATRLDRALETGAAAERFARMVALLGGPTDLLEAPDRHLPQAPVIRPVHAGRTGFVGAVDTRALGLAVIALGGGRLRPSDTIDHAVGLSSLCGIGERVDQNRPLALIHARSAEAAEAAAEKILTAYRLAEAPPARKEREVLLEHVPEKLHDFSDRNVR